LMDGATVAMINAFGDFGLPDDAGALLLVQSDAAGDSAVAELESFQAIAEVQGATEVFFSDDPADSEMFVAARRAVSPAMARYVAGIGGGGHVDDVCAPRSRLGACFARLAGIAAKNQGRVGTAGHAGDRKQ